MVAEAGNSAVAACRIIVMGTSGRAWILTELSPKSSFSALKKVAADKSCFGFEPKRRSNGVTARRMKAAL